MLYFFCISLVFALFVARECLSVPLDPSPTLTKSPTRSTTPRKTPLPFLTTSTKGSVRVTPPPACTNDDYVQCGGIGFTGSTCCPKRSTCVYKNEYYSNCFPTNLNGADKSVDPASITSTSKVPVTMATALPLIEHPELEEQLTVIADGLSGTGKTTRYWDCCKPSCSWDENSGYYKGAVNNSVLAVSSAGTIINNDQLGLVKNGCDEQGMYRFIDGDGSAYMNPNFQPVIINSKLSYGFAAVGVTGGLREPDTCCNCYLITFLDTPAKGKQMVVQHINTGGDLSDNHFDLQMPGSGLGAFDGCSKQFSTDASTWGARFGGVSKIEECDVLPAILQPGCRWRFQWFLGADNPKIDFQQVVCPEWHVAQSGCRRYFA